MAMLEADVGKFSHPELRELTGDEILDLKVVFGPPNQLKAIIFLESRNNIYRIRGNSSVEDLVLVANLNMTEKGSEKVVEVEHRLDNPDPRVHTILRRGQQFCYGGAGRFSVDPVRVELVPRDPSGNFPPTELSIEFERRLAEVLKQ